MNKAERLFPLSLSPSLLSFPPCYLINNYRPQTRGIQDRVGINEPRHHGKVWPGSLRGDLRRDFRKRQPSWALSWALCGLTWMSLTLIFFVRPTPPAYSSHLFMSLPPHLPRSLALWCRTGLYHEPGNQPCKNLKSLN